MRVNSKSEQYKAEKETLVWTQEYVNVGNVGEFLTANDKLSDL